MNKATLLIFIFAMTLSACALLVGIGDHHLEQEPSLPPDASDDVAPTNTEDAPPPQSATDGGNFTILATGQSRPSSIINDLTRLFWINEGNPDAGVPAAIMRLDKLPGATPLVLAPGRSRPIAVRLAPNSVLFSEDGDGVVGLFRVRREGGPIGTWESDTPGSHVGALFIFEYAYSEIVSAGPTQETSIRRTVIANSVPEPQNTCTVYTSQQKGTRFLAINGADAFLYFADELANAILRMPRDCGQTVAEVFAPNEAARIIVNEGANLYWATADGSVRHLSKMSPGSTPVTDVSGLKAISGLAVRGTNVYVTDEVDGTVWWIRPGGQKVLVASGQGGPRGVIQASGGGTDNGAIYWTNRTTGEIVTATP